MQHEANTPFYSQTGQRIPPVLRLASTVAAPDSSADRTETCPHSAPMVLTIVIVKEARKRFLASILPAQDTTTGVVYRCMGDAIVGEAIACVKMADLIEYQFEGRSTGLLLRESVGLNTDKIARRLTGRIA